MATAYLPSGETDTVSMRSALSVSRVTFFDLTATLNSRAGGSCFSSSTITASSFLSSLSVFSRSVASSWATNTSAPEPAHSKAPTPRENSVSGHGSPPNGSISHTCAFGSSSLSLSPLPLGSGRALRNARSLPSGDQRGLMQLSLPRVSSTSRFSARVVRTSWATRAPWSLAALALVLVGGRLDPHGRAAVRRQAEVARRLGVDDVVDGPLVPGDGGLLRRAIRLGLGLVGRFSAAGGEGHQRNDGEVREAFHEP